MFFENCARRSSSQVRECLLARHGFGAIESETKSVKRPRRNNRRITSANQKRTVLKQASPRKGSPRSLGTKPLVKPNQIIFAMLSLNRSRHPHQPKTMDVICRNHLRVLHSPAMIRARFIA
jgi:hypothetical protein